jgi:hypothetical protein
VQENEVFFKLFFPENGRELLRLAKSTKAEFLLLDFLFQLFQKNFGGTMWPPRRRGSESARFPRRCTSNMPDFIGYSSKIGLIQPYRF